MPFPSHEVCIVIELFASVLLSLPLALKIFSELNSISNNPLTILADLKYIGFKVPSTSSVMLSAL